MAVAGVFAVAVAAFASTASAVSVQAIAELCSQFENNTITIGMVTKGNTELTLDRWRPTFEDYLGEALAQYSCGTRLVPLQFEDYREKTMNREIDIVFPNPTAFQELQNEFGVHEFLSVKRNFGETEVLDRFGGVIMRAANNHTDIMTIEDIGTYGSGLKICAVSAAAFGGWHIQWLEMLQAGIDVDELFGTIEFQQGSQKHENSLRRLLFATAAGPADCDIGVARTETFERLVGDGEMSATDLYCIGDKSVDLGFPQSISTVLYPEWPLATLSHVPRDLETLIALPLLQLTPTDNVSITGDHAGFTFPYSYEPVRQMLQALDLDGTGYCDPGYGRQVEFPRQCYQCPAGEFSADGTQGCQPCVIGTYSDTIGSTVCEFCPSGLTTNAPGAGEASDCVPRPAAEGGDYLILVASIAGPLGFVALAVGSLYIYLRFIQGKRVDCSTLLAYFFKMGKSLGKMAFGLMDLVTDGLVIHGVLTDSTVSAYHGWYILVGVLSILASMVDIVVSILVSRVTIQYISGNKKLVREASTDLLRKYVAKRSSSFKGLKSPTAGSNKVAPESAATLQTEKPAVPAVVQQLARVPSGDVNFHLSLSDDQHWNVVYNRLQFWERCTSCFLLVVEDLPMALLGIIFAADVASEDCSRLPGGLMAFMISFGASCLFGGHRFFIATGMVAQYWKMRATMGAALGIKDEQAHSSIIAVQRVGSDIDLGLSPTGGRNLLPAPTTPTGPDATASNIFTYPTTSKNSQTKEPAEQTKDSDASAERKQD